VSQTVAVPPATLSFRFTLSFLRDGSGYNDGYADNLSVIFGPTAGPDPPAPACSVPGGGPGPGPGPTPGPSPGPGGGKTLKLLSFGAAVLGQDGKARVRVTCNTSKVSRCKGRFSASLVRKGAKARGLGTAAYSVPALKSRTVAIKLRASLSKAIRGLSKRALAKARIRLRATTNVSGVKFSQTSSLRLKRPT
jgi:hypothetical protein